MKSNKLYLSMLFVLCALITIIPVNSYAQNPPQAMKQSRLKIDALLDLANKGDAQAQSKLAFIYYRGEKNEPVDYGRAYFWFSVCDYSNSFNRQVYVPEVGSSMQAFIDATFQKRCQDMITSSAGHLKKEELSFLNSAIAKWKIEHVPTKDDIEKSIGSASPQFDDYVPPLSGRTDLPLLSVISLSPYDFQKASGLIDAGADVNETDNRGMTAVMWASSIKHAGTVEKLIKAGADIHRKSRTKMTALSVAAMKGCLDCINLLVTAGADVKENELFIRAAKGGQAESVALLIKLGGDVNQKNEHGYTPLMAAARKGDVPVVKVLLQAGAAINERDNKNATAMLLAAEEGKTEVVRVLANAGVKLEDTDEKGRTALMLAASGYVRTLQALIDLGARVDAKDSEGYTSLMRTGQWGGADVAAVLIKAGANTEEKDKDGMTALMWAQRVGRKEVEAVLMAPRQ